MPARSRPAARRRPAASRSRVSRSGASRVRGGFTLIEMLIAVTLVLLMMLLFGEVFRLATETVSVRKGMAQNDQKVRLLATRVRADLDARTFREVVPYSGWTTRFDTLYQDLNPTPTPDPADDTLVGWEPLPLTGADAGTSFFKDPADADADPVAAVHIVGGGQAVAAGQQSTATANYDPTRREGYLSIGENDPDDDTDDTIAFTLDRRKLQSRGDVSRDFALARAVTLLDDGSLLDNPDDTGQVPQPDQPDYDGFTDVGEGHDEDNPFTQAGNAAAEAFLRTAADGAAESPVEEVVYFVRDGNLIRSRRLVRAVDAGVTDHDDLFSPDGDGAAPDWPPAAGFNVNGTNQGGSFWRFMDLAAFREPATYTRASTPDQFGPRLHDLGSLQNDGNGRVLTADLNDNGVPETYPRSLGLPQLRYGHGWTRYGRPREFSIKATNGQGEAPDLTFETAAAGAPLVSLNEWDGAFVGRFLAQEAAHPGFLYPGRAPAGGLLNDPFHRANLVGANYYLLPTRTRRGATCGARRSSSPTSTGSTWRSTTRRSATSWTLATTAPSPPRTSSTWTATATWANCWPSPATTTATACWPAP